MKPPRAPSSQVAAIKAEQAHLREIVAGQMRATEQRLDGLDRATGQRFDSLGRVLEEMRDDIRGVTAASTETLDRSRLRDIDLSDMRREIAKLRDAVKALEPDVKIVASARRGFMTAKKLGRRTVYCGAAVTGFVGWWNDWWPMMRAWWK